MRHRLIISLLTVLFCSAQTYAQSYGGRAGTWDAGFHVMDASSLSLGGSSGSSLDVSGDIGYGFTGGYNFTNRFAVMLDVNWLKPNYQATFVPDGGTAPQSVRARLDVATIHARGVYYFLDGDVTPFVETGIGWTNVDSNIIDSPPITGCWWDPWWGYICESFYSTYSETRTSYSLGIGVRWDISRDLMMRGSVGTFEIDTARQTQDASVDTIQIDFGWRF
jgi:hypothetical protein